MDAKAADLARMVTALDGSHIMARPWIAIQHNPRSGSGGQSRLLDELRTGLTRHGIGSWLFTNRDEAAQILSDPASRLNLRGIVAAGGDGTLLDVATRYPGIPIAILPLGTENLVARYFGIPRSGTAVANMIAADQRYRLDAARLGDRRFTVMASVGFDADVIHRAHAQRTGHITRAQYIGPIFATLREHTYPELHVYIDHDPHPIRGRVVVVANLPAYALGLNMVPTAQGDDGLLDVRVFQRGSAFHLLRYLCLMQFGRHEFADDVVKRRGAHIRIESEAPVPVQTDGDPAGFTPASMVVEPAYGEFFVPPRFSELHKKSTNATAS